MNELEKDRDTLATLRELPTEVSLEQVQHMVAGFPLAMGTLAWLAHTIKFNLNTLFMTSIGTLFLGSGLYLIGTNLHTGTPATPQPPPSPVPAVQHAIPAVDSTVPDRTIVLERPVVEVAAPPALSVPITAARVDTPDTAVPQAPTAATPEAASEPAASASPATNERRFALTGFTGVALGSSIDVVVEQGPFSVVATGDPDRLQELDLVQEGNLLKIGTQRIPRPKRSLRNGFIVVNDPGNTLVTIRMPMLDQVFLTGSGDIHVSQFNGTASMMVNGMGSGDITLSGTWEPSSLAILLNGSGDVVCERMNVKGATTINVLGSGDVLISGSAESIDFNLLGSGDLSAQDFKSISGGKINVLGSGDAYVQSAGHLHMLTSGSGTIHTTGSAGLNGSRGVEDDGE